MENKRIAIFGGTGSLGTVLTEGLLQEEVDKIYLLCNNENELWESKNYFANNENLEFTKINFIFCDIRNYISLKKFFYRNPVDIVFNCAALKHVGYCEQFPFEAVQTNLLGLENLLLASNEADIGKFIQISTDKAVEPIGVMGATKFLGERMCIGYNDPYYVRASCIRMGNVLNSRGSLIPQLYKDIENYGKVFITDMRMERFFISKKDVWEFIKKVIKNMEGGEIFIPKLELKRITNIHLQLQVIHKKEIPFEIIGRQKGEKLKEKLYSEYEKVEELDWCWVIR